ncbi:MAG: hypothetical protein HQM10_23680 [Candidatus Riflebacteria bacterium]|nr:hypothetical protein [Candidatus Riflebacteria bacterium]
MLRKTGLISLLFLFSAFFLPVFASEKQLNSETETIDPASLKATADVSEAIRNYKEFRKKLLVVRTLFLTLHRNPVSVTAKEKSDTVQSLDETILPFVAAKLSDILIILRNQNDQGYGTISYWTRTYKLNRDVGFTAVNLLDETISMYPGMNNLLKIAIRNTSGNLRRVCSKEFYGDINVWTLQSKELVEAIWQAAANLREILTALDNLPEVDSKKLLIAHLEVSLVFLTRLNDEGYGDIEFWKKSTSFLVRQTKVATELLKVALDETSENIPVLLKSAVQNISNNLIFLLNKYSSGYGDTAFWRDSSNALRSSLNQEGRNISAILSSF